VELGNIGEMAAQAVKLCSLGALESKPALATSDYIRSSYSIESFTTRLDDAIDSIEN
jgi:hypothetical protein